MNSGRMGTAGLLVLIFGIPPPAEDAAVPRGYSIPLIDLNSQTQRQAVVDREPGQYLGHPTRPPVAFDPQPVTIG